VSYLVLARKWRPQTFSDLVGQEHVSRTLGNAIQTERVAHAFLFTGVRGVGKTTSARIMAKALNCEKGPTATPCLTCSQCREIAAGSDVDVQEIDGASYNGVDEVRRLQESLPYRPARDRYKIFIVDEVHMLSQSAWNAFLKTLEEPPPHVKFIFATTEVHKVPVTILSRCQRYDFKLIPTQLIAKRLRYVLEQEHIEADDPAVSVIAREAAGSLRDAMSLLDQAIAWGGDKLVGEEVSRVLGVAGRGVLQRISHGLVGGDAAGCLEIVRELSDQGYDIAHVARDILSHLRDLVVAKVCKEPGDLLDLADEEAREVKALAEKTDADDLVRLHHGFSKSFDDIVKSAQTRAALEMTLVRLARRPPMIPLDDLVERLADLERRLGQQPPPSPPPPRSSGGPSMAPQGPRSGSSPSQSFGPSASRAPIPFPSPGASPSGTRAVSTSADVAAGARGGGACAGLALARPTEAAVLPLPMMAAAQPAKHAVDLEAWRRVLEQIRTDRASLAAVLEHAAPIAFGADRVVLGYEPNSFFAAQATEEGAVDLLTRKVRDHFGAPTPVAFDLSASTRGIPSIAHMDGLDHRARLEAARRAVAEHPLVRAAVEILGAELKDVRLSD
jgi:DNA polymerase-3 subunit gamma/tau